MTRDILVALVAAVCAAPAAALAAGVVGNGTPASCTEAALEAALSGGGTVTFDCGPQNLVLGLTSEKGIASATTIDGGGRVTLSGQNQTRLFRVPDAPPPGVELALRNIRISGGTCPTAPTAFLPGFGAAIAGGAGSRIVLVDSSVTSNACAASVEGAGGAVHVRGGSLVFLNVQGGFNGPSADGGIVNALDSAVTIEDSVFTSNLGARRGEIVYADGGSVVLRRTDVLVAQSTDGGGAVYARFDAADGGLTIEETRIMNAFAGTGDGGAVHQRGGTLRITASTILSSRAGRGGAVFAQDVTLDATNATFYGNRASEASPGDGRGLGGAFYLAGAVTGSIRHSTFVVNQADAGGGSFAGAGPSPLVLRASLLASLPGSSNPACTVSLASGGFDVQSPGPDADCAPGILRAEPGLGAYVSEPGYFPIVAASPARDLVTSGCPPPSADQIGTVRPRGVACDAGAHEWVPAIDVSDVTVLEGNGGPRSASFTVRLSGELGETVTAAYATTDNGATAGTDYVAATGVITFPPGVTERMVDVAVLGDTVQEPSESFRFTLSAPSHATIEDGQALALIEDDDLPAPIGVSPTTALESQVCAFFVRLQAANGAPVTVDYATADGTATAGIDYQPRSGTLTFAPGTTAESVVVLLVQDTLDEGGESFTLGLSNPQNGTIGASPATCWIGDDDGPGIAIGDAGVVEGNSGTQDVELPLTLAGPTPDRVLVFYETVAGTAGLGDYATTEGVVTFAPGEVSRTVHVTVLADIVDEPDERFHVSLYALEGGFLADGDGVVTIVDDDGGDIGVTELVHGSALRADLDAGTGDLFVVHQPPFTSWEVVVDEASGDLGSEGPVVVRLETDLTTIEQESTPAGTGTARVLRWSHAPPVYDPPPKDEYVFVTSLGCAGGSCGPDDVYRIRAVETTLRAPRFNCVGGQGSALVLQNTGTAPVTASISAWRDYGTSFTSGPVNRTVAARGTLVFALCGKELLEGQSGSLTIAHDGAYGQLAGKVVSVDPATGASFDTPLTARPR